MIGTKKPRTKKNKRDISDEKKAILELLNQVKRGEVQPLEAHVVWDKMNGYKEKYLTHDNISSWNSFIGRIFEKLVYYILKTYVCGISKEAQFRNLCVFSQSELKGNDYLFKKLSIKYGEEAVLPDTDMAIVDCNFSNQWLSEIVAIISCKTSLRERIAQACYWKLKLVASDTTKHVRVFLATSDNDRDFVLKKNGEKSRDRIIAEWELDGVYILRGDFKHEWESKRVKQYEQIFNDLVQVFKGLKKGL